MDRAPQPLLARLGDEQTLVAATKLVLAVFAIVALRAAWMSDDSYVTMRTVDNFVQGHGLTWNPGERVQAYTHPLWMFVLAAVYALTDDAFVAPLVVSVALSVAAVWVLARKVAPTPAHGLAMALACLMSRSFVDYSTSGLENPLTHLLLALFAWEFMRLRQFREQGDDPRAPASRRALCRLVLWGSLIGTNRLDLLALVGPGVLAAAWPLRWGPALRGGFIGATPLIAWEGFSLVYYGSFVPNTALAKLGHGVEGEQITRQGLVYLFNQLSFDPLSVAVITALVVLAVTRARRRPSEAFAAAGVALYLVYVYRVGGDFMAGRFFTAPMFLALCLLPSLHLAGHEAVSEGPEGSEARKNSGAAQRELAVAMAAIVGVGFMADTPTASLGTLDASMTKNGVVDERQYWGFDNHLIGLRAKEPGPYHSLIRAGRRARRSPDKISTRVAVGMFGYAAGPEVFVIDPLALGDPFLAHLPANRGETWRPGHAKRHVPLGYLETIETGDNRILDPDLAQLYDELQVIHTGPLFTAERWRLIWKANTGGFDALIDERFAGRPYHDEVPLRMLQREVDDGVAWNAPGTVQVSPSAGIRVTLDAVHQERVLQITADHNDQYLLRFFDGEEELGFVKIPKRGSARGMSKRKVQVPAAAWRRGYDALVFERDEGDRRLSLGAIEFLASKANSQATSTTGSEGSSSAKAKPSEVIPLVSDHAG